MKNREKYADKIIKIVFGCEICDFMKNVVLPGYVGGREYSEDFCSTNSCEGCSKLFAFWLDEDYEAPPTDWANVPVDTLVRVRDNGNEKWILRYFKGFSRTYSSYPPGYDYEVWGKGATSVTAEERTERWRYCELAEDAAETERVNRWRMKN